MPAHGSKWKIVLHLPGMLTCAAMIQVLMKCCHAVVEIHIITCEMLSNFEKPDWNEIFKGGQNDLWQWGHWVIFRCPWHHFVRWTVVLLVCNMRSQDLGGLQKWWYRSSWNVAMQWWKSRSSHVKCCQTLRNQIETRSSRADRTIFVSEDIEWCLFCWHSDR